MTSRVIKVGLALGLVLAIAGGLLYWRVVREIPVRTAAPEQNVEVRVFGIGTIEAQVTSKVGFQIAGRLVSLEADQGDVVKAGALLAKLDDAGQRAKLAKTEAAKQQAAANLARAQAQRDRAQVAYQQKKSVNLRRQTLVGRGSVSQEAAEDAQAAEDIALSDIKVIESDVLVAVALREDAAAQHRIDAELLAQHELRAPFDVRIIARHKELGSVVNPGEIVFTLVAPASIWVRAFVDEALAGGLEVGQTAFVRLRSEPGRLVETEIVRIDQEGDRVTEERRLYVRCRVCDPQHQLRFLGEQAEVEIVKQIIPSGVFLPLNSVEGFDGRSGVIWVVQNGRLAKQRVELGARLLDGRVQVLSDLPAGTVVVVEAQTLLREGRAARPARPNEH
jgi:HlyD family secretion protein